MSEELMRRHAETLRRLSMSVPSVALRQVELLWLDRALRRFGRAAADHDRDAGEEIARLPPLIDELPAYVAALSLAKTALKWSKKLTPEDLGYETPGATLSQVALVLSRALDAQRPDEDEEAEVEMLEVADLVLAISQVYSFDVVEEMALQVRQLREVIP